MKMNEDLYPPQKNKIKNKYIITFYIGLIKYAI